MWRSDLRSMRFLYTITLGFIALFCILDESFPHGWFCIIIDRLENVDSLCYTSFFRKIFKCWEDNKFMVANIFLIFIWKIIFYYWEKYFLLLASNIMLFFNRLTWSIFEKISENYSVLNNIFCLSLVFSSKNSSESRKVASSSLQIKQLPSPSEVLYARFLFHCIKY